MLALGLFVTIAQVIRIFTISKLVSYTNSYSIIIWSIVEINLGVSLSYMFLDFNCLTFAYQGHCVFHPLVRSTS
jgi:hypothetical protein